MLNHLIPNGTRHLPLASFALSEDPKAAISTLQDAIASGKTEHLSLSKTLTSVNKMPASIMHESTVSAGAEGLGTCWIGFAGEIGMRERKQMALALLVGTVALSLPGCAHRAPASIHNDTALISGHNTIHASQREALQTVLVEAAAITVDHGYRYFELMAPVRPGVDVPIRVFGSGENPNAPSVYDANAIAAGQLPASAR